MNSFSNCLVQVGTLEAQDLELTVETLRCRQDAEKSSLVKKVHSYFLFFLLHANLPNYSVIIECFAQKDPSSDN
jgi:hypothetical protein